MDFPIGIERSEANITVMNGLSDEVKKGDFSVVGPNEGVLDQEQADHGDHRPQPNGFQRVSSMLNRTCADVRRDVKHFQRGFKAGQRKRVFDQPDTSEDDEIHDTEEASEHRSNNPDEGQCERFPVFEVDQWAIG